MSDLVTLEVIVSVTEMQRGRFYAGRIIVEGSEFNYLWEYLAPPPKPVFIREGDPLPKLKLSRPVDYFLDMGKDGKEYPLNRLKFQFFSTALLSIIGEVCHAEEESELRKGLASGEVIRNACFCMYPADLRSVRRELGLANYKGPAVS